MSKKLDLEPFVVPVQSFESPDAPVWVMGSDRDEWNKLSGFLSAMRSERERAVTQRNEAQEVLDKCQEISARISKARLAIMDRAKKAAKS